MFGNVLGKLADRSQGVVEITLGICAAMAIAAFLLRVPLVYNVRNLLVRWITTLILGIAFMLVVGLITAMLAFVNGMYQITDTSGRDDNLMILSQGSQDEVFSNLGFTEIGDVDYQGGVKRWTNGLPMVSKETYLIVNQPLDPPPTSGPKRRFIQVRGVDDPQLAAAVRDVTIHEGGTWFSQAGVRAAAGEGSARNAAGQSPLVEAIIGEGIAKVLARDRTPEQKAAAQDPTRLSPGETFRVGDRQWVVSGVMRSAGYTFDSEVWAKRSLVGQLFGKESYTTLLMRTESKEDAIRLRSFFATDFVKAQLEPRIEKDYFASLQSTNKQFEIVIGFIAFVMGIGGVLGVMITMFAAVAQRTRDIGVMRLLGFSRNQIVLSFLLESMLIAIVGGLLGCALGMMCNGQTVNSIVGAGPGGGKSVVLKFVVDHVVLSQGMLLALGMGFVGGLAPALAAMRLTPLAALR